MSKDLTNSAVDRQNILNNPYALAEIEKAAGIRGIPFEGKTVVLKEISLPTCWLITLRHFCQELVNGRKMRCD